MEPVDVEDPDEEVELDHETRVLLPAVVEGWPVVDGTELVATMIEPDVVVGVARDVLQTGVLELDQLLGGAE